MSCGKFKIELEKGGNSLSGSTNQKRDHLILVFGATRLDPSHPSFSLSHYLSSHLSLTVYRALQAVLPSHLPILVRLISGIVALRVGGGEYPYRLI
jgi:hypothetical protein